MASTKNESGGNGNNINEDGLYTAGPGNEIKNHGLVIAGFLLVAFIILPVIVLIGYWPDKMPAKDMNAFYQDRFFHMRLIDSVYLTERRAMQNTKQTAAKDKAAEREQDTINVKLNANKQRQPKDTIVTQAAADPPAGGNDGNANPPANDPPGSSGEKYGIAEEAVQLPATVHLNTILLILVAAAGFLGTMIHTTSSFSNFVGAEKFKSSWTLWYVIKPFTGASLAIIIYFVFRAGLFNFNDPTNINLYGLITLAAFTGLFTDNATLKLKEIFEVVFKPKDDRPDKIEDTSRKAGTTNKITVSSIAPQKLDKETTNNITIQGKGFAKDYTIKIDDTEIQKPVIDEESIRFAYSIPPGEKGKTEFKLVILDKEGKQRLYETTMNV